MWPLIAWNGARRNAGPWRDTLNDDKAATHLAVARMAAVLGMAFTMTAGILLLVGGWLLAGGIALLAFLPFFGLMRFLERSDAED